MLSKKTKYAINALVYLAKNNSSAPVHISKIAENENIPGRFLEEIMLHLRNAGIVRSKKGANGGYSLQSKAEEINVVDVVRLFDGAIGLLPCVAQKYYERCAECKDEKICGIRIVFAEVRKETLQMLEAATLQEINRNLSLISKSKKRKK